ncbi:FAD dependent oxidoreductase [Paenibacillus rigui]|uniref:FAD dependent oxidoreductase n=1 Tax=Paenibacillus rigui TaxID=554312 RepID=A0A229UJB8_9BACL|nr:FAD dependent oxidoreductase [Paenibacillus rigui]
MDNTNEALLGGKAIIIGGSVAGLMTAKVLSAFYREILIVEKDVLPDQPVNRTGTPHGFHPHRFTNRGKMITERLFPGYEQDLLALGAPSSFQKTVHNMNQYGSVVGKYPRNDIKFSRAALEWVLRRRVQELPQVHFLTNHDVIELAAAPDSSAVTGVKIRNRAQGGMDIRMAADLVVDTSGRQSKLAAWLEQLGYAVPTPDLLKVSIGYSTRRYQVPKHLHHLCEEWDVINIAGQPANGTYTGVFSFIENHVAEMVLYRPGGQYPPTDAEAFERCVERLPTPIIAEILQQLEPITSPRGYRVEALYRHHYEQMSKWPKGLLVLGDAYCIFDPIFGQGMTVAALEAEALESCLKEQRNEPAADFERQVLHQIQTVIEPAWWLNCANDLQWEDVEYEGTEPLQGVALARKYMALLLKQGTLADPKLFGLYWAVNTLSVSPREIWNPVMVEAVLSSTEEGKQILQELLQLFDQPLREILPQLLPSFACEAV